MLPLLRLNILKDQSNLWIFLRLLLLEILYGGETSKTQGFRKNPSPFASVRQVRSGFSQIKLGLNWRILMQHWARIAINKSDPAIWHFASGRFHPKQLNLAIGLGKLS